MFQMEQIQGQGPLADLMVWFIYFAKENLLVNTSF
jgi:hypothetical protein